MLIVGDGAQNTEAHTLRNNFSTSSLNYTENILHLNILAPFYAVSNIREANCWLPAQHDNYE